jgi:hypothetical protein
MDTNQQDYVRVVVNMDFSLLLIDSYEHYYYYFLFPSQCQWRLLPNDRRLTLEVALLRYSLKMMILMLLPLLCSDNDWQVVETDNVMANACRTRRRIICQKGNNNKCGQKGNVDGRSVSSVVQLSFDCLNYYQTKKEKKKKRAKNCLFLLVQVLHEYPMLWTWPGTVFI